MQQSRRAFLTLACASLVTPAFAGASSSAVSAWSFSFDSLEGGTIQLGDYAGKPLLVVNTASQCGFTPQFTALQALYARFKEQGLMVVGVPSNDFGGQEPGLPATIAQVAHDDYGVTFPLASKTRVRGPEAHRFYKWAAAQRPNDLPGWNFHKYLIGPDGQIAAVFSTLTPPDAPALVSAVERQLAAQG